MPENHGGIEIVRAGELSDATNQSTNALRMSGIDGNLTAAQSIWMGKVFTAPGYRSDAHHHGDAETAGYVLKGKARLFYGESYKEQVDLDEGDFVFVPPNLPHIEANRSDTEELVWLTARTRGNVVVNLGT